MGACLHEVKIVVVFFSTTLMGPMEEGGLRERDTVEKEEDRLRLRRNLEEAQDPTLWMRRIDEGREEPRR